MNKSEDQVLTDCVIPFIRTGVIGARWGKKVQSYQVLELRIYGTREAWHKAPGVPLKKFIGRGARNRYPTFEARARKALATSAYRVFVIMPLQGEEYGTQDQQRILREYDARFEAIEALLAKYSAVAIRIDREHTLDELVRRIKSEIAKCTFVIADLTDERPSCYYEAGYAEALRKPILFIASKESVVNPRSATKIHFDIHRNVNFFVNNEELGKKLRAALDKNKSQLFRATRSGESDTAPASTRNGPTSPRPRRRRSRQRIAARPSLEPNNNERSVLRVLAANPGGLQLKELAELAFPKLSNEKANSWTRNSLRRPLRKGMITKIGPGKYRFVSDAKSGSRVAESQAAVERTGPRLPTR